MYSPAKSSKPVDGSHGSANGRHGGHGDVSPAGGKNKCVCPLYTYKRFDKLDPVHNEAAHYPPNLKTVYTKDYTPKKVDQNKMDFSPLRTVQKTQPMRDNYLTTHKKDFTPKAARSTTPIRNPEHNHIKAVPFVGHTEYKDMTKDAGHLRSFTPVKTRKEEYHPTAGNLENTEYQHEYTPKRTRKPNELGSTAKTALPDNELNDIIFKGSTQKKVGPMDDRTVYRVDFTPKKGLQAPKVENATFTGTGWDLRPKMFDGLTIYKKDYVGPAMYACECPNGSDKHSHHGH